MPDANLTTSYRDIAGFPGYRVGSDGSVWSQCKPGPKGHGVRSRWRRLSPGKTKRCGHRYVTLPDRKSYYVHRLVLEAFVGPCPLGAECRHFPDKNPENNSLSNLSWGTPQQNAADKRVHGTHRQGEACPNARLTAAAVVSIREAAASGAKQKDLARQHKTTQGRISMIVNRKIWKHIQ